MFLVMGLVKASLKLVASKKNVTKTHPTLSFLSIAWEGNKNGIGYFSTQQGVIYNLLVQDHGKPL